MAKFEYLSHLLQEHNVDIVLLQMIQMNNNTSSRYTINVYSVVNNKSRKQYGIIT